MSDLIKQPDELQEEVDAVKSALELAKITGERQQVTVSGQIFGVEETGADREITPLSKA